MTAPAEVLDDEAGTTPEAAEPTVASLAPAVRTAGALVEPAAGLGQIEEAFKLYQELCDKLLVADDYQQIGSRSFRKKSAWRKLAVAFGVSCEILKREYDRDDRGRIMRAEVVVRATAPNGRAMDGLGACDLFERCCTNPCHKSSWNDHTCCAPDCPGTVHFSHPQHDIPATASTRATNRACADLFGMGEVSAEEVVGEGEPAPPTAPAIVHETDPWRDVLGNPAGWFDNRDEKAKGKRKPGYPDFKARNNNIHWNNKGERNGDPAPLALWLNEAPEGFAEALALRDQGLDIDWELLDIDHGVTGRGKTAAEATHAQEVNELLECVRASSEDVRTAMNEWWKREQFNSENLTREQLDAAHAHLAELKARERASSEGSDVGVAVDREEPERAAGGHVLDSSPSDPAEGPTAEEEAFVAAGRACALCGSTRTTRVEVNGRVRCTNAKMCARRADDRAAAQANPCKVDGCKKAATKDDLCDDHEVL